MTDTADDGMYRRMLEAATTWVEQHTHRVFQPYTATRTYTPRYSDRLDIDDLISVTTLRQDTDDDYSYTDSPGSENWATTDYRLWPSNASVNREPYVRVWTTPNGDYSFLVGTLEAVQIVGTWGYYQNLETVASLAAEAIDATETAIDVDAGTDFDVLETILIDSEQMYITGIATNTLTVIRGVNGTTAATHDDNSVIQRYLYPAEVSEATGRLAERLIMLRTAPLGVVGSSEVGQIRVPGIDRDIERLLAPFKKLRTGAIGNR